MRDLVEAGFSFKSIHTNSYRRPTGHFRLALGSKKQGDFLLVFDLKNLPEFTETNTKQNNLSCVTNYPATVVLPLLECHHTSA
jgi:hypothetical protein